MCNATPQLYASLSVALGGGIGALARYQMGRSITGWLGAPADYFDAAPLVQL